MYAYIDETGNTGPNLFDPGQPVFITGALMTRGNFDLLYRGTIRSIAKQLGVDVVHANELGMGRLEEIAPDLLRVFKISEARIFIARVVKLDLAAMKLVDTIFDSGENLAVPWFSYNATPLRLLLTIKVAFLLDEEIIKLFWSSLMNKNEEGAYDKLSQVLAMLLPRAEQLPDARSQNQRGQAATFNKSSFQKKSWPLK